MTEKQPPKKIHERATIANLKQLDEFIARVKKSWDGRKAVKVEVKTVANTRTLDQNALLHVWIDEITQFWNDNRPPGCLHTYDPEWTKNRLKQQFGEKVTFTDPITAQDKTYLLSTAKYGVGQMYHFMVAIQVYAMENLDLILESKGVYKDIQDAGGQIPDGE